MTLAPNKRRYFLAAASLALVFVAVVALTRVALTGMAIDSLLRRTGASEIKFSVSEATPWRVVVDNLGFQLRTQAFAARRVSFNRDHWWTPSLGSVHVEQVRVPVTVDGSDVSPTTWSTYPGTPAGPPPAIPAEEISVDGQLIVQAAALPDQTLALAVEARPAGHGTWTGRLKLDGPGVGLRAEGTYDPARQELVFRVPEWSLDLKPWQGFVQHLVLLPGGGADLEGKLAGSAEGRLEGRKLVASAVAHLRAGRYQNAQNGVLAEGVEADLELTDVDKLITKPGSLRVRALHTGQLTLTDLEAEVACEGFEKLVVSHLSLKALGGSVAAEPFKYFPALRALDAVLVVDGVSVEEVMAMTKDLPAQAAGRVDGRVPIRIDGGGLRFGTGWLALKPGVFAQVQFNAGGLLTNGVAPGNPSYAVLKKIESGLLKLKISELRLDIRPPDAPAGRSAQLHLRGEPVDPDVKAPVILDLNVNGPLEKLINMGMDSRVSFGAKP